MKIRIWHRLLLLTMAATMVSSKGAESKPPDFELAGNWESTVEAGKFKIRLIVRLSKSAEGKLTGKIDLPDQGTKDVPVSAILCNYPAVRIEIDPFDNLSFNGKVNPEGNSISGVFDEGPGGRPLVATFKRLEGAANVSPQYAYTFAEGEPRDFRGYWKAAVEDEPGHRSPIGLKIGRAPDGTFGGMLALLEMGLEDAQASLVRATNGGLHLEWQLLRITIEGQLAADATKLTGTWKQNAKTVPVQFERLDKPASALPENLSFTPDKPGDIRGYWKGTLDDQGNKLRLVLRIGTTPDGVLAGTMASLDQGGREMPMTRGEFTNSIAKLEWKPIHGVFKGTLNTEGTVLDGTWEQMGPPLNLKLERTVAGDDAKAH
jgi:hypothetical protein